ncbi:hypothetical protein Tcan_10602 [Toxocara canis]|uniref:Uncharacterized protein n=1 Tax=Toxocara canis TaxID=6265 RepID=A0A0B2UPQ7_TOXCA|nr:hypothetical protein Tcan_10602 [Toxocara canis]
MLPSPTSAISDKLQVAVQPVVDRLDKLMELISTNQSPATQSWVQSQLYSGMTKVMQWTEMQWTRKGKERYLSEFHTRQAKMPPNITESHRQKAKTREKNHAICEPSRSVYFCGGIFLKGKF